MARRSGAEYLGALGTAALLGVFFAAGCSGAQPKQAGENDNFDQPADNTPMPNKWEGASDTQKSATTDQGGLSDDQKEQMKIALRRGGDKASHCADVVPDSPTGDGEVHVIMDGQKGRITDVNVGAPWAGTGAEACIKRAFIGEIILRFDGAPRDVPYSIKVEKRKASSDKAADKGGDKTADKKKP